MHTLPVAIIGAGPVGLATVARLIERDLPFVILEAGSRVGTALLDWGHVHTFSNWGEHRRRGTNAFRAGGVASTQLDRLPHWGGTRGTLLATPGGFATDRPTRTPQ
ncbi:MAG UNVERIFIED_CONTAM: NAD(P)-binding protein [Anaerolineae bacterium]